MLDAFVTRDVGLLRGFLQGDPARASYLLGDLDPPWFERCRWFVAVSQTRPIAVLLSFETPGGPVLLGHGAPDGMAAIFHMLGAALPPRCWAKIPAGHREAFDSVYSIVHAQTLWTMELTDFRSVPATDVIQLSEADLPDMLSLYRTVPDNHFDASRMPVAPYFGRYDHGRLVSVAGTHVHSGREHVAVLGDIATVPDARNRGHARAVTSRLIDELYRLGCKTVALQVAAGNAPAIAAYRQLGFVYRDVVLQARCERR